MTADVPSFVSACSHSCPACCFTHIYNHIWYIYIQLNKCYIYIYITYHYLTTSICRIEFYLRLRRIIEVPKTVWLILTRIKDGSRTFALSAWSQWAGRESRYHLSHDAQNLALLWFHSNKQNQKHIQSVWSTLGGTIKQPIVFQSFSDIFGCWGSVE
jgi:hypothetical protein